MFRWALFFLMMVLSANALSMGNQSIDSFQSAKEKVYEIFFKLEGRTLYCGCKLNEKKEVDASSCGYEPKQRFTKKGKVNARTLRAEVEHIVPAHAFGQAFIEWREPKKQAQCQKKDGSYLASRKCAGTNLEFARMEADLFNLWPAIGEINAERSNFRMAEIPGEKRDFGKCDVEIQDRKVEPPEDVKGWIARAYLYMNETYPNRGVLPKSGGTRTLIESWHKQYPPTEWEKKWALEVQSVQGNCNAFVLTCK